MTSFTGTHDLHIDNSTLSYGALCAAVAKAEAHYDECAVRTQLADSLSLTADI